MTMLRPGQRVLHIPGIGVTVTQGRATLHAGGGNWWEVSGKTCLTAYQPKGAADYAASKINLATPGTYNAADGTTYPTWSSGNGWSFTATSQHHLTVAMSSGTKPVTIIARVTPSVSGYRSIIGDSGFPDGWQLRIDQTTNKQTFNHAATAGIGTSSTGVSGDSVVGVTYSNVGAFVFYLNGSPDGSGTTNVTFGTSNVRIGRMRTGEYFNGYIAALAVYSDVLTGGEFATVSAAMAAL